MTENSKIEWTDHTFNPWMGCTKVSAACDHCYAEVQTARFKQVEWGPHADRKRTSAANWRKVATWNKKAAGASNRPRVFVASLADVFDNHKSILPEWREEMWQLIRECPNLDFLLLTKRPQNIAKMLPDDWRDYYANVWLGTTVENQEEADRRIPHLLGVPAAVHFLSCEPLLGPVDLQAIKRKDRDVLDSLGAAFDWDQGVGTKGIDWVICGGESAPDDNRRDMDIDWVRSLRDQCAAACVPFLFKQHSGRNQVAIKALGRKIDGVVHNGYPEVTP